MTIPKIQKHVLAADDDPAILDVIRLVLEEEGYRVTMSSNDTFLESITQLKPDVILLDILMSGCDGREICRRLKSMNCSKYIPVIFIAAHRYTREISEKAGAQDYLLKPFEINDLIRKVAYWTKFADKDAVAEG